MTFIFIYLKQAGTKQYLFVVFLYSILSPSKNANFAMLVPDVEDFDNDSTENGIRDLSLTRQASNSMRYPTAKRTCAGWDILSIKLVFHITQCFLNFYINFICRYL